MSIEEFLLRQKGRPPLTFEQLHHDDVTPAGTPGIDNLLLGEAGDRYYGELGDEIEKHPLGNAGIRRS